MQAILFLLILLAVPLYSTGCAMIEPAGEEVPHFRTPTEHYNKALDLYQKGNYAQAKELFREFVAQYPDSPLSKVALYYLGHCYQMTGDDKEALILFNRIVATYGDDDFWGEQSFKRIKQIKGEE
jgi:TolA-binding protein